MPNARDAEHTATPKFLVLGKTGTGKTSGFLTIPGRKFAYLFDPNSLETLRGADIEYEEFLPDDLSLKLTSLSKKNMDRIKGNDRPAADAGASLYGRWENDFESKLAAGFFDDFDAIAMDSFTTLSDLVMDGVLAINGRAGQWPNQDDYGPQMMTLTNIVRTFVSLGKIIYFTGHIEMKQDEATKRMINQPLMTGRLRSKLPLLFSEILITSADTDMKGNTNYTVQTRPDRYNEAARCTIRDAKFKEDVTIDWTKPVEGQGIWRIYK